MNNQKDIISLEVNDIKGQFEVFLNLDKTSLDFLIKDLQRLQKAGDHTHYMSDDWGGVSLTTTLMDKRHKPVHHFQITRT